MCVQALYSLQACIITVLVGLIVRTYSTRSIFCVRISGADVGIGMYYQSIN